MVARGVGVQRELVQHPLRATGGDHVLRVVPVDSPRVLHVRLEGFNLGDELIGSLGREVIRHLHLVLRGLLTLREPVDGPVVRAGSERDHLAAERVHENLRKPAGDLAGG